MNELPRASNDINSSDPRSHYALRDSGTSLSRSDSMASITFGRSAELIPQFNTYAPIGVAPLIPPRPSSGAKGTIISLNTPPKSWEIDYDELRVENELGRGAFGIGKELYIIHWF